MNSVVGCTDRGLLKFEYRVFESESSSFEFESASWSSTDQHHSQRNSYKLQQLQPEYCVHRVTYILQNIIINIAYILLWSICFGSRIGNVRLPSPHPRGYERLQYLNLDSLQCRRVKADLIMCYKVLQGLVDLESSCIISAHCISQSNEICSNKLNCLICLSEIRSCLVIVLLILWTISLWLVLSQALNGTLTNLDHSYFLLFCK